MPGSDKIDTQRAKVETGTYRLQLRLPLSTMPGLFRDQRCRTVEMEGWFKKLCVCLEGQ